MKPLSERDENISQTAVLFVNISRVGMKPLSERDENSSLASFTAKSSIARRNEATL